MKTVRASLAWVANPSAINVVGQLLADHADLPAIRPGTDQYLTALFFEAADVRIAIETARQIRGWLQKKYDLQDIQLKLDGYTPEEYVILLFNQRNTAFQYWAETLDILKKTRQVFPDPRLKAQRLDLERTLARMRD